MKPRTQETTNVTFKLTKKKIRDALKSQGTSKTLNGRGPAVFFSNTKKPLRNPFEFLLRVI